MASLLFRLNNVPDDEADEVRQLLSEHNFDTYETTAGRWHISVAAIWLRDDSRLAEARAVLADYQAQRADQARARHAEQVARGEQMTFNRKLRAEPLRVLFYIAVGLVVLGLSTLPFLQFID